MHCLRRHRLLLVLTVLVGLPHSAARADISRREANQLAVDVLTLRIGGDVRGLILKRTDAEIQIAVRRAWLAEHQPALLQALPEQSPQADRYQELVERIEAWLADLDAGPAKQPYSPAPTLSPEGQDRELIRVLKAEREVYQEYLDDPLKMPPGEGDPAERREAYRQLVGRFDRWLQELEGASPAAPEATEDSLQQSREELVRILKTERENFLKLAREQKDGEESQFAPLTLSRADVKVVFQQSDERRQLAVAGYQKDVAGVESASVADLQRALQSRGVDWRDAAHHVSALMAGASPQSDREWAARRAVYEYQFLRRLDFQGTGNFVVQTGEGAPPPDMAGLLQGMLDQQTSIALGDLLEEPIFTGLDFGGLGGAKNQENWLAKATRIADQEGVRGFRVTRMTPDMQRRQTIVEDRFLAKMPDGRWEVIWMTQQTKSARDADPNDLQRIRQDPQLKQVLGLVEGLGLAGGGQLDVALQFGAATMNAQQATDDEFYEFRDRYSQRLDGPPLSWQ